MTPDSILIVEDDSSVRETLSVILEEAGYHTVTARNGSEAIDYLSTHPPPRAILIDLMMPVMDGLSFRAAQLQDPALAAIPTVILSAARDGRERARALGVYGFLQKPIELVELLKMVRDAG